MNKTRVIVYSIATAVLIGAFLLLNTVDFWWAIIMQVFLGINIVVLVSYTADNYNTEKAGELSYWQKMALMFNFILLTTTIAIFIVDLFENSGIRIVG